MGKTRKSIPESGISGLEQNFHRTPVSVEHWKVNLGPKNFAEFLSGSAFSFSKPTR
jgi:hypothetical protein